MRVCTLFFCGTDCGPDEGIERNQNIYSPRSGYIPAKLHHQMMTNQNQLKVIVPGPGGSWSESRGQLFVQPSAGMREFGRRYTPSMLDTLIASSMQDLADHSIASILGDGLGPFHLPTTVNMIAHSRGGVVAIMAAHKLYEIHPSAKINIFAIDPVPGAGNLTSEMVNLPPNVTNYVGVYALDETSGGFNALIPRPRYKGSYIDPLEPVIRGRRISIPHYHLLHISGRHGSVAGNGTRDGNDKLNATPEFSAVGELVNCLATACLRAWGSKNITQARDNIKELRKKIRENKSEFRKMRDFTYLRNTHSPQHWIERGVTSSEGRNPKNWHYLEDAIGSSPLVQRISRIPNMIRRARPNPGRVIWASLDSGLSDKIILDGKWPRE